MDIALIETLRWEPDEGFVRLERHLARLVRSAEALGLPGAEGAREALLAAVARPPFSPLAGEMSAEPTEGGGARDDGSAPQPHPHSALPGISPRKGERDRGATAEPTPLRIRLELSPTGAITIQTAPFTALPETTMWRLKLATTRLASTDPLIRHKTTARALYTAARAEYAPAEADEVLLLNERGELCEGTITSLFLDDGTGILKTPPLASGLLAGILREELLETGRAVEQVLGPEHLTGQSVYVGNSLRGLIRATF